MQNQIGMIFGAQYYRPPFPDCECWERDIRNMKELGFNTVKLWAVWNDIEREPGCFTFHELDKLMDLIWSYQMRVVINIIPEGAPYWTLQGNEDALYKTSDGRVVTYGGPANLPTAGWPGLCMDKPEAKALLLNFIKMTAAHFSSHPALLSIDVWNEPHLEPMFDYRDSLLCYCTHSVEAFRLWLKNRYGSILGLNEKWFRRYICWEEVVPPPRFGTGVDMIDWRLFWLENLAKWMSERVAAAREGAPEVLIQSHVAYSGYVGTNGRGGLANELGDEFLLAPKVDVFGLTCFPDWLMKNDPLFNHMLNNEIIASASRNKPFYQVELQGGGGKAGWLGGIVPNAEEIRFWNYLSVAAGGKGVTYWQYAPEPAGMESPGFGLTGFKGENTERSKEAGRCAKELTTRELGLSRSHKADAMNAIYLSRITSLWFFAANREEQRYAAAIHGAYRFFWENGIPVTFAHSDYVDSLFEDGIRTLLLPSCVLLSKDEILALHKFVCSGGTIISDACPGMYSDQGVLDQNGEALKELFGLQHIELQAMRTEFAEISKDGSRVGLGSEYRQIVRADESVDVRGYFEDGYPAYTERMIGNGRAIWIGTFVFGLYGSQYDFATEQLILKYVHRNGYRELRSIICQKGDNRNAPVIRLLKGETGEKLAVLINTGEKESEIIIQTEDSECRFVLAPKECKIEQVK